MAGNSGRGSSGGNKGNSRGNSSDNSKRGLASADQETRERVAREGGKASHEKGGQSGQGGQGGQGSRGGRR